MKLSYFVICLLFLACHQQETTLQNDVETEQLFSQAYRIRFSHPGRLDSLLSQTYTFLAMADDEQWFHYTFLRAHLEMVKGNYTQVFHLLDSISTSTSFAQDHEARINLLRALVYEKQLLYEPSYESFKQVLVSRSSATLSNDEMLIALLGKARIEFWLMADYKNTFEQVQVFLAENEVLDLSHYHANAAILDQVARRNYHLKMSEVCAMQCQCYYQLMQHYIQHAAFCQEQDSVNFYLAQAMTCKTENQLDSLYSNTYLEASYLEMKSKSLHLQGRHTDALVMTQEGIALALSLRLEDKAYRMCLLRSDVQFALQDYAAAMSSKDEASRYRLAYAQRINADKMKYLEAKGQADKLKQENQHLWAEKQSKTFQVRWILAYSVVVTLIIYGFYRNRRRIKRMLILTRRQSRVKDAMIGDYKIRHQEVVTKISAEMHRKEMMLKEKQVRLEEITTLIKESPYKDKSKLKKIETLVSLDQSLDTWEVFYEAYSYKYPQGEKQMRACFPSLSTKDYQYLMCVHYGFNHDKMARLFGIQKASVRKRSLRLKKALAVPLDTEIKTFLLEFLSD